MLTSIALLGGHGTHVRRAAFSPDGSRFAVASSSGRIVLYGRDGKLLAETVAPATALPPMVLHVAWSADDAHVAAVENGTIRLRRTADLAIVAERDRTGNGPIAFCDGGRLLAVGAPDRSLRVLEVPALADRGAVPLEHGDYDTFDIDDLVADPAGTVVASSDNGGYSENEIGGSAGHGPPKVTIIDAGAVALVREIEHGRPAKQLELDRWRERLLVVAYTGIGVWDFAGAHRQLLTPYADREQHLTVAHVAAHAIAVSERWLATVPETQFTTLTIDFWDPTSYAKLATSTAIAQVPAWIAASPDGTRLVTVEPNAVRLWAVEPA